MPHRHGQRLARCHQAGPAEVQAAIEAALEARHDWAAMAAARPRRGLPQGGRAARRPVAPGAQRRHDARPDQDGLPGRDRRAPARSSTSGAGTSHFVERIYAEQPRLAARASWNRLEYRPLEGFVFAVTPVQLHRHRARNLPTAPALMGNTVRLEAGLDRGALRLVHPEAARGGRACRPASSTSSRAPAAPSATRRWPSPDFAGPPLHRLDRACSTGCGGPSARTSSGTAATRASSARPAARTSSSSTRRRDVDAAAVALVRGAFEYQGQKCSAASRAYVPESLWPQLKRAAGRR